jgi:2-dehydro-3-deoxyphosphogalactonate aldolase
MSSSANRLVAILRGITPADAPAVATVLHEAGVRTIEVTLNSPEPLSSIQAIAKLNLKDTLIGAGTVLRVEDVSRVFDVGGRLIVTPNTDVDVISQAVSRNMNVIPGFATATEAFAAIRAGAKSLKLFPAVTYGVAHLKALRSVLGKDILVYAVGGIGATDIKTWVSGGADGFGFGSELFRPEYSLNEIRQRAVQLVAACDEAFGAG